MTPKKVTPVKSSNQAKTAKPPSDDLVATSAEFKNTIGTILKTINTLRTDNMYKKEYTMGMITTLKFMMDSLIRTKKIDTNLVNVDVTKLSDDERSLHEKVLADNVSEEDKDLVIAVSHVKFLCENFKDMSQAYEVLSELGLFKAFVKRKATAESMFSETTSQNKTEFKNLSNEEKEHYKNMALERNMERCIPVYPSKTSKKTTNSSDENENEYSSQNVTDQVDTNDTVDDEDEEDVDPNYSAMSAAAKQSASAKTKNVKK
jgi:hypothetical protein